MKNFLIACLVSFAFQSGAQIKLIVRADDMGSCRAANLATIDGYKNGIISSTEVMVPCPWFNDAAALLSQNPGLDVGLHMVLNSEWVNYRWRPLTAGKTITDPDGFFHQMVWGGGILTSLNTSGKLDMAEVEAEFRAQIVYAIKKIPQITHISEHMYFGSLKPELSVLIKKLAEEYHLGVESSLTTLGVKKFNFPTSTDFEKSKTIFIASLKELTPGTYHFFAHPCVESIELSEFTINGKPSTTGAERIVESKLFTDPEIIQLIKDKNIELIGYKDLLMREPSSPSLLLPLDSAQIKPTSFSFEWTPCAPDIEKYQIEISLSEKFETVVTDSTLVAAKKTYTRSQLPQGRKIYWRVRAKNSKGWGAYSKTFQLINTYFTALNPPKMEDGFKAYFSASQNTIHVVIPETQENNYVIVLSDMSGRSIQTTQVKNVNSDISLKTNGLKSGVYVISASNLNSNFNQKIVVD